MSKIALNDKLVEKLEAPSKGLRVVRDKGIRGLAVRILPSGSRAFVFEYSSAGRRRVFTIGSAPEKGKQSDFTVAGARKEVERLRGDLRNGINPADDKKREREAATVSDLIERFKADRFPKLRATTVADYERMLADDSPLVDKLGKLKVAAVRKSDIDGLHKWISDGDHNPTAKGQPRPAPVSANLNVALASSLFNFAVSLEWTDRNPARGVKRNEVESRSRYLSPAEMEALTKALKAYDDQLMADLFRLLLLTGARRGETRSATWDQFDRIEGYWCKPAASTKQKKEHRLWLTAPAKSVMERRRLWTMAESKRLTAEIMSARNPERQKLMDWRDRVEKFVFPARDGVTGHVIDLKKPWNELARMAKLPRTGANRVRIHDLRHSYASVLASGGASLQLIGALLGHSHVQTTQRYAHLTDHAQREAAERASAVIAAADKPAKGKVIQLPRQKRL